MGKQRNADAFRVARVSAGIVVRDSPDGRLAAGALGCGLPRQPRFPTPVRGSGGLVDRRWVAVVALVFSLIRGSGQDGSRIDVNSKCQHRAFQRFKATLRSRRARFPLEATATLVAKNVTIKPRSSPTPVRISTRCGWTLPRAARDVRPAEISPVSPVPSERRDFYDPVFITVTVPFHVNVHTILPSLVRALRVPNG